MSLENRSMWEQIHVEDVAVGDCYDIQLCGGGAEATMTVQFMG